MGWEGFWERRFGLVISPLPDHRGSLLHEGPHTPGPEAGRPPNHSQAEGAGISSSPGQAWPLGNYDQVQLI